MAKRRESLINTGGVTPALYTLDPTHIDTHIDSRSISFENPTGARGGGGKAGHGRKGNSYRILDPGESVLLADLAGPGTLRHIWMAIDFRPPEVVRALRFEVFYEGAPDPSISVPILDFFGLPHGRRAEYYSAMISTNEGRGLNSHIPIPFTRSIRVVLTNESERHVLLFYAIDYTLEPSTPENPSYLHATFRRENPTTPRRDFVIADGFKGPGRFLGCSLGIRVLDKDHWYGEGQVKIYRDGDRAFPTCCGTGLEDYVGSADRLGRHYGPYSGAPINIPANADAHSGPLMPDFVSFYRWHLLDPIMFSHDLRVTIQQIGSAIFKKGQEAAFEAYKRRNPTAAVRGWLTDLGGIHAAGLVERSDDYCATAFVYCSQPQSVARYKTDEAVRDIALLPVEQRTNSYLSDDDELEKFNIKLKHY